MRLFAPDFYAWQLTPLGCAGSSVITRWKSPAHNLILEVFVMHKVMKVVCIECGTPLTSCCRVKDKALSILLRKVHQGPEKSCHDWAQEIMILIILSCWTTILKIYIQVNSKALHCIPRYWSMTYLTEASNLSHIEGSFKYITFSYIQLIPMKIRSVHNSSLV